MAAPSRNEVLKGTLDMMVLQVLDLGPMHGWGITELLERESGRLLQVGQGSLYPALYRLESQGLVKSSWDVTPNNRRARYYRLTRAGRRRLTEEREEWKRISRAVSLVMRAGES